MRIDLWADVVCPACYFGDNRLIRAIAESGYAEEIDLVLHAFELHPDTPDEVLDNSEVLARMMGVPVTQVEAGEERFAEVARADGLPFAVTRKHRNTNTMHRVLKLAAKSGAAIDLMSVLQRAAFSGRTDAFDHSFLVESAVELGLERETVVEVISSDRYSSEVEADRDAAISLGARGVPFAVFDGKFAVPGAVSLDVYARAISRAITSSEPVEP